MNTNHKDSIESWQEYLDRDRRRRNSPYGEESADDRLIPNPELPIGETAVYRTVSITTLPQMATAPTELVGPLEILGERTPANGPAEGVMLTHEQAWRMKGVTLGKLLHSMCLAPGEVTQLAVTNWSRTTRGESEEDVDERERAAQEAGRQREVHDITHGVATESQHGLSVASTSSTQIDGGIGGVLGLLGGSAASSTNTAVASSVNFNVGARDVSADSNQSVRETTQQHAANARGRRAALVQEVSESETEQFKTRVVANYNHTHSLNMMYYEVLQVYELSTRVTDARRCLFIPMEVMRFTRDLVVAFSRPLARAAERMGPTQLAHEIEQIAQQMKEIQRRTDEITRAVSGLADQKRERERQNLQLQELNDKLRMVRPQEGPPNPNAPNAPLIKKLETEIQNLTTSIQTLSRGITATENKLVTDGEELKTLQEKSAHAEEDVMRQLNDRQLLFNQALWMQLDPAQVAVMVAGKKHNGLSLTKTINPIPVAVVGNFVGFYWDFPPEQATQAAAFRERHLSDDDTQIYDRDTVVVPTGGIFAEAVPGRANSAEKLDLTRFWKWDADTIPILPTAIANLHHIRRAPRAEAKPGTLGVPSVTLKPLPNAPAPPAHQLASVVSMSLFRDMSGSEVIQGMLEAAQKAPAATSQTMQKLAHDNISAYLDHIETLIPKISELMKQQGTKPSNTPQIGDLAKQQGGTPVAGGEGKGIDPSNLGALQNALGKDGAGLDIGALLGDAAELGVFL